MNKYKIILYFIDEDDVRHPLGSGVFWCDTSEDACECAMQTWWSSKLEEEGCRPFTDCTRLPQYRVVWEPDEYPDHSWLEQWNTPESYYDVRRLECPGDHLMALEYAEDHIFRCPECGFEIDVVATNRLGKNNGVVLDEGGEQVPFEDYKHYWGNPDRHAVLVCRVEEQCRGCGDWNTAEVLGGVDFMDTDNFETGVFHETELNQIPNDYQRLESWNMLEEARHKSFFPKLREHLEALQP